MKEKSESARIAMDLQSKQAENHEVVSKGHTRLAIAIVSGVAGGILVLTPGGRSLAKKCFQFMIKGLAA